MTSRATGQNSDLKGYIEVKERIAAFIEKYPEGSLQAEIHLLNDDVVVMKEYAYRTADDARPGVGWSSLQIPGSTPYTLGSEIENCETSAWGRAIAALGFKVDNSIASQDEVANKRQQANREVARFAQDRPDASKAFGSASRMAQASRAATQAAQPQPSASGGFQNVGEFFNWALEAHGMGRGQILEVLHVQNPSQITDFAEARQRINEVVLGQPEPA